jgi:photosystem II stability/assembly factor-like uncharacterized protein
LTACQGLDTLAPGNGSPPEATSVATPALEEAMPAQPEMGIPPGPVLTITPLPDGEFLAGVGPVGDAETGFEWRLYRGRGDEWRRLTWPPEAIPRSLHSISVGEPSTSADVLLAVPFSNALFGRGQAWGLMRSTDGGRTWQQALTGLGDPYIVDLAVSPSLPGAEGRIMLLVTWYHGVYRSTDDGQTWEPMSSEGKVIEPSGGANPYDLAVAISPDYSQPAGEGLVLASFSRGLHRWQPANETWQTVPLTVTATLKDFEPPEAQLAAGAIAFSPEFAEDGVIYLYSGYAGIFRSADRGETWKRIDRRLPLPPPFVTDFHLAVASADEVYVLLDTDRNDLQLGRPVRVLYRTLDGGRSWEALDEPPTLGWVSAFALGRDPQDRVTLHLGGSRGGVSSYLAETLPWD